jgi:signal transduction histidine kinase/CheY-like chemotaxis protein
MTTGRRSFPRDLAGWLIWAGAVLLPFLIAIALSVSGATLLIIATAQAALGVAWAAQMRRRMTSSASQRVDATIHQLLKIRRRRRLPRLITRALVRVFGASHATLFLEDPQTRLYRLAASYGPGQPTAVQQLDDSSLLIRWLLEHRKPLRAHRRADEPDVPPSRDGAHAPASPQRRLGFILQNLRAELVVPSVQGKRLVGFVVLGPRAHRRAYAGADVAALSQLAASCPLALDNATRFERLETAASKLSSTQTLLVEQQRLADAGKLALGLAHEIKNPLTGIKTFTEFLQERYDDPKFRQEFTRIVPAEVARINRIVQSLSDFARPPLLKLQAVDIQQVLVDTVSLLSNECLKRDIRVTKQLDSEPIYLTADPAALKQTFLNLCLNALDAMGKGGTLSVSSCLEETVAVIRMSDTGSGIPQEHLATLFDPFFTTKEGGMGLGLAVVKQIVNQHLGTISVESNMGFGTTFEIRLPHAVRLKSSQGMHPPGYGGGSSEPSRLPVPIRVLVVDDEPKILEFLKERFEHLGAKVRTAPSGEQALEVLAQEHQELAVLDLKLPNVDGFEVLKRIRAQFPTTAVAVITGMYDEQIDAFVRSLGALACIHKPLDLPRLQEVAYQVAARSCPPAAV